MWKAEAKRYNKCVKQRQSEVINVENGGEMG